MSSDEISIIVDKPVDQSSKGLFLDAGGVLFPLDKLKKEFHQEVTKLVTIFEDVPMKHGWKLEEVEVGAQISAEGSISFIGSAKVGSHASFKLKFKR